MSNKSKLVVATAIAGLATAVLGLGSQAFAKRPPTPENWHAQTYSVANGGNFHLNLYYQQTMALTTPAFSVGGSGALGHVGGGFNSPVFNSAPPPVINNRAPVFNPSEPNTVPESRETAVSPASPSSLFGNG